MGFLHFQRKVIEPNGTKKADTRRLCIFLLNGELDFFVQFVVITRKNDSLNKGTQNGNE